MRAYVPDFDVRSPKHLSEALEILQREPGVWRPLAGGTDLMVLLEAGRLPFKKLLNIWQLDELRGIEVTSDAVTLGALTTYAEIREHALLNEEFPLLVAAAKQTGAVAIQNRGTLGGNIVNASPAADTPPALLVYETLKELRSAHGSRWVPYLDFHLDYKKTVLSPTELLCRVRLPRTPGAKWREYYRKVGTRGAQAISKVCLAGRVQMSPDGTVKDIRLAFGAVASTVKRVFAVESLVRGYRIDAALVAAARSALAQEIKPVSDIRSDAGYRLEVAQNLLEEFLTG